MGATSNGFWQVVFSTSISCLANDKSMIGAKYEFYCMMNDLAAKGKSIIMISSELPEVLGMSDRILVMHNGTIKGELTGAGMTAENVMQLAID